MKRRIFPSRISPMRSVLCHGNRATVMKNPLSELLKRATVMKNYSIKLLKRGAP